MRSGDRDLPPGGAGEARGVARLLDLAFGFLVWAAHFLSVYVVTALACVLGLGSAGAGAQWALRAALLGLTAGAAALVALHALRAYRRPAADADRRALAGITVGNDAIAAVGILWQVYPILLVPACR